MRVLVTGVSGFAGRHLVDLLLTQKGIEIHGLARFIGEISSEPFPKKVRLYRCDIRDATKVRGYLKAIRPERIYHLAAQTFVPASWDPSEDTVMTNLIGELNIFEAVRALGLGTRILVAGSSEAYGRVSPREMPISEAAALRPVNPYGISKAAQDLLARQYHASHGLPVVVTRAFNHTGPGQDPRFAASDFARQVALSEAGRREPVLEVGDLGAVRDFTDVRDVVRAYGLLLEKGESGEAYNVCSGRGRRVRDIVDVLLKQSRVKVKIKQRPARRRSEDIPVFVGDPRKLKKRTGWRPRISFETTILGLLDYWRKKIDTRET